MARDVQKVADLRPNARPVDPDVVVPAAVRRAAEAAEAAHAAQYGPSTPAPTPSPTPVNPDTIQIADPPAPTPAPAPTPQPAPVTPTGNEPPPAPQQWPPEVELELQRVRSAEGRKRAELLQQLNGAADRISALETMVHELKNTPTPAAAPAPAPQRLITEQEANEFGPEMLDVMGRRAKEAISPELAELRRMMEQLEQKAAGVVTTVAKNARSEMLSRLDQTMPEWRGVNQQAEFKAWLALPDPLFGVSRHSALLQAYEQNDTARVLAFFKSFISELAATTPDQDPVNPPAPVPAKPSLETLAAPGRARTSAQPNAPAEKQIITTADIDAFYDAVRRGMYVGREAEKQALEQELFVAQRENRVRSAPKRG